DAHPEIRSVEPDLPVARLAARLPEDPPSDRNDVARLLGKIDPLARHQDVAFGRLPADEGLDRHDRPVAEVDDRLVVEPELISGLDAAESLRARCPLGRSITQPRPA